MSQLRLQSQLTVLELEGSKRITLPVGPRGLADAVLLHDPPTPAELERAIEVVEDALMASRLPQADRGALETGDSLLLALPGMQVPATGGLTRNAVEALFQGLRRAVKHCSIW
jgi:hypothetical protein